MIINQIKQMLILNNFKIRNVTINIDNNFSVNYILENVQIITLTGVQKMTERANEVRGKFWPIGENFYQQFKN